MKPYTKDTTCPKCKAGWYARQGKTRYCDGLDCPVLHAKIETARHGSEVTAIKRIPPAEHLHCICSNCGYEWLMECADAKSAFERLQEINDKVNPAPTVIDVSCPGCYASISYWLHNGEPSLKQWSMHTEQQP